MLSIFQLKLHGFKSFKHANIELPDNFTCLAGPNGSGKSNVCDSIRFVLGEQSLRALRTRKIKDLIFTGMNSAEVILIFKDEKNNKYEIKRAIRTDGKILYKLNGKKTTRTAVMEFLKQYNLDESGRNIIAQGRIQRIVEMTGKERREIIENVAGISDFEKKKKEAIKELDAVGTRLKEANIVYGERNARLCELKKEREIAIKYKESRDNLKKSKGSLLKIELSKLESEFNGVIETKSKLSEVALSKNAELDEIGTKIFELDRQRSEISKKIQEKQSATREISNIEKIKASIQIKTELLQDREKQVKKLQEQKIVLEKDISIDQSDTKKISHEVLEIDSELKKISPKEAEDNIDSNIRQLKEKLNFEQTRLYESKDSFAAFEGEINTLKEVFSMKNQKIDEIEQELSSDSNSFGNEDEGSISKICSELSGEISNLFEEERSINHELANIDRDLLKVREKAAQMRVYSSPQASNPALSLIKDLKESGKYKGIYGLVCDLISFDPKYTSAVEAALSGRLLHVVVDCTDTATKIIDVLKKMKSGRATFIPLDRIKPKELDRKKNLLINYATYNSKFSFAMEYVFSDTILVDDVQTVKSKKMQDERIVTLDGELFEKSGIITGGKTASSLLASAQIKKLDDESEDLKEKRRQMIVRLEEIREEGNRKRKEKAELEVKLKGIEIEKRVFAESREKQEKLKNQKKEVEKEVKEIEDKMDSKIKKKSELQKIIESQMKSIEQLKADIDNEEKSIMQKQDSQGRKRTEIASKISSLKATFEGKQKELELRKTQLRKKEIEIKDISQMIVDLISEINKIKREIPELLKELENLEERVKKSGKEIESLFNQLKNFEEKLKSAGEERGKIKIKIESYEREKHQNEIKEATIKTRLVDLKTEFEEYGKIEFLNESRDELIKKIKEYEATLNSIESVNLSAIELYESKLVELEELGKKITLLEDERKAILEMISGIDKRKIEIFSETFEAVNKNFQDMLNTIPVGKGHLYLDDPDNPFESSLHIKIQKNNRDVSIDSLSGGESSLVALAFIFAIQFYKPSPFYILDEADAALDKQNSNYLAQLIRQISDKTQFLVVSHNDSVISGANAVLGVAKVKGISKIVGVKLENITSN
ncbi:MAG: chromosome segregation SMC family protein [Candidatus Micrarchaeia archaeon]